MLKTSLAQQWFILAAVICQTAQAKTQQKWRKSFQLNDVVIFGTAQILSSPIWLKCHWPKEQTLSGRICPFRPQLTCGRQLHISAGLQMSPLGPDSHIPLLLPSELRSPVKWRLPRWWLADCVSRPAWGEGGAVCSGLMSPKGVDGDKDKIDRRSIKRRCGKQKGQQRGQDTWKSSLWRERLRSSHYFLST